MWFKVDGTLGALVTPAPVSSESTVMGGFAYDPDGRLHVVNDTPAAGSPRLGGLAATTSGALYITTSAPNPKFCNNGVICDSGGRAYLSEGTTSHTHCGLPFLSDEAVNADSPVWEFNAALGETLAATCSVAPTITRAGDTATRVNSSGLIETVVADTPRFDYDPVTLALRGLLVEEARTNLLLRSAEFDNASWGKSTISVTANAITGPDGALSGDKAVPNNGAVGSLTQGVTISTATTYTYSIYAKAGEWSWLRFQVSLITGTRVVWFNLASGSIGTVQSGLTASIVNAGGGWYRCIVTGTSDNTVGNIGLTPTTADNTATVGDGTSGIYLWGAQIEAGAFATSYIPTTSATVTRNADVITLATASIPGFTADVGTLFAEFTRYNAVSDATSRGIALLDLNNRYQYYNSNSLSFYDGVNVSSIGSVANTNPHKAVIAFSGVTTSAAFDGAAATTGTFDGSFNGATLHIGGGSVMTQPNAPIRKLRLYNVRKSNAALQAMTQ